MNARITSEVQVKRYQVKMIDTLQNGRILFQVIQKVNYKRGQRGRQYSDSKTHSIANFNI